MAEGNRISYEEAYARAEAILDEFSPVREEGFSQEAFLEIVADEALSRLKRKAKLAASLDTHIKCVTKLFTKARCRMHGGAKGSGAPKNNQNALKDGFFTREAIHERRCLNDLLREGRKTLREIE